MNQRSVDIVCSECGADTLLKREPVYDGFKKVGEKLLCSSCGHEFAAEAEVPFKEKKKPAIFGDDDRPKTIDVFKDDPKGRNCRHCEHYVVNPFTQRCGLTQKIVQATDVCDKFEKEEDEENTEEEETRDQQEKGAL